MRSSVQASSIAALGALICWSAARSAPPVTPESSGIESPPTLPNITAEAGHAALERRVELFVRALTRNSGSPDDSSAVRWNTPICLFVAGMSAESANIVSDRVSQISSSAGARLARSPCQPNFIIVSTTSPGQVLHAWYARNKQLFGDASPAQIRQFLASSLSRPVRVWYNINRGRKAGMRNGHFIPSSTQAESSVFLGNAVSDFISVVAIIDTPRTETMTLDQLAEYVAMTGLTYVDPSAELDESPSILRLFSPTADKTPTALSGWDTAFLKALYQSDPTSKTQRVDIEQRVTHDILR